MFATMASDCYARFVLLRDDGDDVATLGCTYTCCLQIIIDRCCSHHICLYAGSAATAIVLDFAVATVLLLL